MITDSGTGDNRPDLAIYDLVGSGHHRMYLESMIAWWLQAGVGHRMEVWIPKSFLNQHDDFRQKHACDRVGINQLPRNADPAIDQGRPSVRKLSSLHRNALQAVFANSPRHVLCMYLDHAQWAVRVVGDTAPPMSGILFRSQLGYRSEGIKGAAKQFRKKVILRACLPKLAHVLCLDPYEIDKINALSRTPKAVHLPDGVPDLPRVSSREALRNVAGLSQEEHVAFMGGSLAIRKGILWLQEAVDHLSEDTINNLVLVFVGAIPANERDKVTAAISAMAKKVKVIFEEGWASDQRLAEWWTMCDSALIPYVQHVGSSHILLRAAQMGKPVIGTYDQLLGTWIREQGLGLACIPEDPDSLARALETIQQSSIPGFDESSARSFGSRFTLDTMFDSLTSTFSMSL